MTGALAVAVFLLFAGRGIRTAFLRVAAAEEGLRVRRRSIEISYRNMSSAVRAAARWSRKLTKSHGQSGQRQEELRLQSQELRASLDRLAGIKVQPRWVLEGSMRGMSGRYPFMVSCSDPRLVFSKPFLPDWSVMSWTAGRLVFVAGKTRDDAFRRAETRWPLAAGFSIRDALAADLEPMAAASPK